MKKMKNLVALLLVLAMCFALTACGGSQSAGDKPAATAAKAPEETASPAYVYVSEFRTLIEKSKDYATVRSYGDDGIYYSTWEKVGENIPEGVKPQYEGQYDVYEAFLYHMDRDGNSARLENYKTVDAPTNDKDYREFSSGSDLSGIVFTPEGFVTVETAYSSWSDGDGNYTQYSEEYFQHQKYRQDYYIRSFDRDGNELTSAPIEVPEDAWLDAYRMQLDDKGNVVLSDGQGLRAIGLDGQDAYDIAVNGYVNGIIKLPDGRLAVAVSGETDQLLCILDSENGKLIDGQSVNFDLYSAVTGDENYDLYYSNGAYFYGYKLGDKEPTKLFNWINCDVNGSRVSVLDVSDGVVTGMLMDYDTKTQTYSTELVTVHQAPYDSVPHKQPITSPSCISTTTSRT